MKLLGRSGAGDIVQIVDSWQEICEKKQRMFISHPLTHAAIGDVNQSKSIPAEHPERVSATRSDAIFQ
jgi:hypothetical protein